MRLAYRLRIGFETADCVDAQLGGLWGEEQVVLL